jgi:hypothetical protein
VVKSGQLHAFLGLHGNFGELIEEQANSFNRKFVMRRLSDVHLLYAARAARGFGDGFANIILPAYLSELGFGPFQIGIVANLRRARLQTCIEIQQGEVFAGAKPATEMDGNFSVLRTSRNEFDARLVSEEVDGRKLNENSFY